MKKLFFIFILFFSSNAHSSIIELEDCYLNDDLKSKKWNEADYNLANTFFIKFTEHNRRESAEYPYGVRDSIRSYKGINEEELLSKGYKKIKQWEKYSITIDDRYITILRIVTDEWLENQREYKRRELERWEKYGTNLPASAVENFRNYQFERRDIDKFKIDDVIANFIYGVGQIFSVEINTDNLEFKQSLSLDTLKKGRRDPSNFTHICNSKQNKNQSKRPLTKAECTQGNCQNGQGTYTSPDGAKYVGEFKDDKINGQGTYTSPDGTKYVGEWKDGKKHGQGTYTFPSGAKYVGEYKDNKSNGQGTYTYANGDKYVGEHKDGKSNGQGTYTFANGDKYVGEWKDGKQHGQGTGTSPDGRVKKGIWENGKLVKPN